MPQLYSVNQYPVQTLLTWIQSDEIAVPEIQRPFVWKASKVRDFIDSLYFGYPVGYLIAWRNPSVRLKDGSMAAGRRILIDGQQRVTALLAAILGRQVVDKNYRKMKITIAFHPSDERFEVSNPAICRNSEWIPDIVKLFDPNTRLNRFCREYCESNPNSNEDTIFDRLEKLRNILNNQLGLIELNSDLEIKTVSEIFVRINSQGVPLNAADFVMSKIAANENYNGHLLRKCIDCFCHLAKSPESYCDILDDHEFTNTEYFNAMNWLKQEKEDLYDPSYTDMLRVTFTSEFRRGRLEDLVALLSGRNFETLRFEEIIIDETFSRLKGAIMRFMNETDFKRFIMILRSAGFINSSMIRSQNAVNFAYILYLTLRAQKVSSTLIETLVRRWYVMSVLTGRYTGSFESRFGEDIRNIYEQNAQNYLYELERAELSDVFWDVGFPQQMNAASKTSPSFCVFLASQVYGKDKGFLSKSHTVQTLLEGASHVHHVFPQNYLKRNGLTRTRYNQIANYVVMQSEINIAIKDAPPSVYFASLRQQCENGIPIYGGITNLYDLRRNLQDNCIPELIENADVADYDKFLKMRRSLMSNKIRDYYKSL